MKLDKEYQTMYIREKDYLIDKGISPTFSKWVDGVKVFKFEKTQELFVALAEFYKK